MANEFTGKVAFITGAAHGQGRATALALAREGARIAAFDVARPLAYPAYEMGTSDDLRSLEAACRDAGSECLAFEGDVRDDAAVTSAVEATVARFGRIDVLFNNAGICAYGLAHELSEEEWDAMIDINLKGAWLVARRVIPVMIAQKSGVIANVSSLAGVVCPPFDGIYSGSKHALEALSEALYYELHPFGVRVLLIEPGGFATNIENTRRYPKAYGEGSPYAELDQRFEKALQRLPAAAERADPQIVADLIYDAVNDKEPKLRYLIGQDAEMIGGLRRQMDDATFEKTMRQSLDFWD
jgi:NAD(P)-dependent dehydrogenase (short-subunit alcohol dehydrogenase family)